MEPSPITVALPDGRQGLVSSMYGDDGAAVDDWEQAAHVIVEVGGVYVGSSTSGLSVSE